MESPWDSDASEGMRELVEQGFAIKSRREHTDTEVDYMRESHGQVRDMDVYPAPVDAYCVSRRCFDARPYSGGL